MLRPQALPRLQRMVWPVSAGIGDKRACFAIFAAKRDNRRRKEAAGSHKYVAYFLAISRRRRGL